MVPGRESGQVDEDVTGWVGVPRRTRKRVAQGHQDEGGKSCKKVQIFVKMDGSRTIAVDVAPNDKVSDMMKRIPSCRDMYVTSGGRVLRRSDERVAESVVDARFRSRAGCGEEEDTKTRRAKRRRASE